MMQLAKARPAIWVAVLGIIWLPLHKNLILKETMVFRLPMFACHVLNQIEAA
ncbi:hypothetical protein GCWU000324_00880 [Kingella oralis ATCC 51147]|uniref:Uncharacterized protein n=1 Tax=Kingella oralis ATCC 51147 TaxID=629741 RepID=C4GFG5_9NEIS|nr:hypothetical protein GCWU000324_00880 [Kingella oralis ATCC 51147]